MTRVFMVFPVIFPDPGKLPVPLVYLSGFPWFLSIPAWYLRVPPGIYWVPLISIGPPGIYRSPGPPSRRYVGLPRPAARRLRAARGLVPLVPLMPLPSCRSTSWADAGSTSRGWCSFDLVPGRAARGPSSRLPRTGARPRGGSCPLDLTCARGCSRPGAARDLRPA